MRAALNIESGRNDGILPIVVRVLGLAIGAQIAHGTATYALRAVVEEIGIGAVAGIVPTWLTISMLRFAEARGWISGHWEEAGEGAQQHRSDHPREGRSRERAGMATTSVMAPGSRPHSISR